MPADTHPAGGPGAAGTRRFAFRFARDMAPLSALFGVRPATTWVEVGGGRLRARFGPWSADTTVENIGGSTVTGPYSWWKVAGPVRLTFSDRGATFATNHTAGLQLDFRSSVGIVLPGNLVRSPNLTVTVADPDALRRAIDEVSGAGPTGRPGRG